LAGKQRPDPKVTTLEENRTLHRHPEAVADPRFQDSEFFDARDLLQVKYVMLRRADVDGDSITAAATAFGFSRPAFYEAQRSFQSGGIAALIWQRPGPRRAHKLSDEVMSFVEHQLEQKPPPKTSDIVQAILDRFGIEVHRRGLERAKRRRVKKLYRRDPSACAYRASVLRFNAPEDCPGSAHHEWSTHEWHIHSGRWDLLREPAREKKREQTFWP